MNGAESSDLTLLTVEHHKDSKNFLGISNLSTANVTSITYDSVSKLLLVTSGPNHDLNLLTIEPTMVDFIAYKAEDLSDVLKVSASDRVLGLKQGNLYLQDTHSHYLKKISMMRSSQ